MPARIDLSAVPKAPPARPAGKGGGRLEGLAWPVLWAALGVSALLLLYLFWGMYGGAWADPAWRHQAHAYHARQLGNIVLLLGLLRVAAVVLVAALLVCCRHNEGVGYLLLGTGAALYFAAPLLAVHLYAAAHWRAAAASADVLQGLQTVGMVFGAPGLPWSLVDVARRLRSTIEAAAIRRANLKYSSRFQGVKRRPTAAQRRNQTYQLVATALLIADPALILVNLGAVQDWVGRLLVSLEGITRRLSLSPSPGGLEPLHGADSGLVLWAALITLNFILLMQALRLLEYLFFRKKP